MFLGRSIINRLEQIHPSSGTSCVQPLLLLVGSASLFVPSELQGSEEEKEIRRMREFILTRLAQFSISYLSEPMHRVRSVVAEIFKQLDHGVEVFWVDILRSMGLVTIIG